MVASRDARRKAKEKPDAPVQTVVTKPIGGEKNGGTRTIVKRIGPKWYPTEDVRMRVPSRKHIHKPTRLRKSITPGTVLILLAGRFRGHRVVFLKQLASGLLLVTGPYSLNGIPLRRVDQRYMIATSTKLDVSKVTADVDDSYFKRERSDADDEMMADVEADADKKKKKASLPADKVAKQKQVDAAIIAVVLKEPFMKSYMKSRFTLNKGMHPHAMKF